jgi:hypothetical protein
MKKRPADGCLKDYLLRRDAPFARVDSAGVGGYSSLLGIDGKGCSGHG